MGKIFFDQEKCKRNLKGFFSSNRTKLNSFGSRVNQTFEANTFASTIKWYQRAGWTTTIVNPFINGKQQFRLKFSTRGRPGKYTYVVCEKNGAKCQIRHQLRVNTKSCGSGNVRPANICCDVVIANNVLIDHFSTNDSLPNQDLVSFGEAKHMSAFAELVAGFIGLVHELKPKNLRKVRTRTWIRTDHISPFLNVSGTLYSTARGLTETVAKRKMDIDIYSFDNPL